MDTAIDVNKFFEYNNPTVKGYSESVYMNSNAMNMNKSVTLGKCKITLV